MTKPDRRKNFLFGEKWRKIVKIAIFLKKSSNDFAYIAYLVRGDDSWSSCKNCIFKKNWFSSYCPKCLSSNQMARFLKIEYLKNCLSIWADFLLGNSESWKEHDTNIELWVGHIGGMSWHAHPCPHSDTWGLTLQKKSKQLNKKNHFFLLSFRN